MEPRDLRPAPFRLRAALREDVAALQDIERTADQMFAGVGHPELADGAVMPEDAARRAIDAGCITVAEIDGAPVGFVRVAEADRATCVAQLSVLPAHGRRGLGAALLAHAVACAKERGHDNVWLVTQSDVPWNRPFYERRGFVVVPFDALSPAMRAALEAQIAAGLDAKTRVAMRRALFA